jgi:hypothetical protein
MEAMTPGDRDLAEIASWSRPDPFLSILAGVRSGHMLGLLTNGMTVYGRSTSPRAVAVQLDEENVRMAQRWESSSVAAWWLVPTDSEGRASFSHPIRSG